MKKKNTSVCGLVAMAATAGWCGYYQTCRCHEGTSRCHAHRSLHASILSSWERASKPSNHSSQTISSVKSRAVQLNIIRGTRCQASPMIPVSKPLNTITFISLHCMIKKNCFRSATKAHIYMQAQMYTHVYIHLTYLPRICETA